MNKRSLRSRPFRQSAQRTLILEHLTQRFDHPTVATVYADLHAQRPTLSLGTVYRNLEILERQGRVRSLTLFQRQTRYDAHLYAHAHFLCQRCGAIHDLALQDGCCRQSGRLEALGHRVMTANLEYIGVCRQCRRTEKKTIGGKIHEQEH